ncbi:MAG: HopJ type III effector protein [Rickettsiales bacterium]|jgi:hypothetical protein|nr:HopJ type III effector protein [Rickettsiales bacterium]
MNIKDRQPPPSILPEFEKFSDVLAYIDENYYFTPRGFRNGELYNKPKENQGSEKVFSFASMNKLSKEETLKLFCEHYAEVLSNPDGASHPNIREFMKKGWAGIMVGMPANRKQSSLERKPLAPINENIANIPSNYLSKERV